MLSPNIDPPPADPEMRAVYDAVVLTAGLHRPNDTAQLTWSHNETARELEVTVRDRSWFSMLTVSDGPGSRRVVRHESYSRLWLVSEGLIPAGLDPEATSAWLRGFIYNSDERSEDMSLIARHVEQWVLREDERLLTTWCDPDNDALHQLPDDGFLVHIGLNGEEVAIPVRRVGHRWRFDRPVAVSDFVAQTRLDNLTRRLAQSTPREALLHDLDLGADLCRELTKNSA